MFLQVIVEVALRRKGLFAPEVGAVVGFFTCVDPQMRLQIPFLVEGPLALLVRADELLVPRVGLQVHLQPLVATVGFIAPFERALILLHIQMRIHMVVEVSLGHE